MSEVYKKMKIFVATGILVFDFGLFIGVLQNNCTNLMRFILQVTLSTNSKMSEFIDKFMSPKYIIGYNSPTTARLVICQFYENDHSINLVEQMVCEKHEICKHFQWPARVLLKENKGHFL